MTANDNDLLRQYVREQSETAFAELVRRHVRLVYSTALRRMRGDRLAPRMSEGTSAAARNPPKASG